MNIFRVYSRYSILNSNLLKRNFSEFAVKDKRTIPHIPVLKENVLEHLDLRPESKVLDMTFGAGGHTKLILEKIPAVKVYCLDRDPLAHNYALELSKSYSDQVIPLLGRFSELPDLLNNCNVRQNSFDAILFDFGCSSMQFDDPKRGFSVSKDGPLDMRMDGTRFPDNPTAADVLAHAEEHDLHKIMKVYGEEKKAKKIARCIIEARYLFTPLQSTRELADFISSVLDNERRTDMLNRSAHVATKVFQALRIFVNNEINEINYGMIVAQKYLKIGGKLVTLTFHSLEDIIVKRHVTGNMMDGVINELPLQYVSYSHWHDKESITKMSSSNWKQINKHVITPSESEVLSNPRSRSAKLRAIMKTN